jgi:Galactose oxidase, central domain
MSGDNDRSLSLEVVKGTPLIVERKNTLDLRVKSKGYKNISVFTDFTGTNSDLVAARKYESIKVKAWVGDSKNPSKMEPRSKIGSTVYWTINLARENYDAKREIISRFELSTICPESEGNATIGAQGWTNSTEPKVRADPLTIVKSQGLPVFESFKSDKYFVGKGGRVTLSWKLEETVNTEYDLFLLVEANQKKSEPLILTQGEKDKKEKTVLNVREDTDFTLKITEKGGGAEGGGQTRSLRVLAKGYTQFDSEGFPGGNKDNETFRILGLYSDNDANTPKLYALALEAADKNRLVSVWSTDNPFRSEGWDKHKHQPISLDIARRPGIVFDHKLFLIGGDCSDPNRLQSNRGLLRVDRYRLDGEIKDFSTLERQGNDPWPTARMGHALVAPDQDRIWMVGGWQPNGGTLNEIWEYDGESWKRLAEKGHPDKPLRPFKGRDGKSKAGRCMFGAAVTSSAVWVAGGFFTGPGVDCNDNLVLKYNKGAEEWTALPITMGPKEGDNRYCSCTLFTRDNVVWAIITYVNLKDGVSYPSHHVAEFKGDKEIVSQPLNESAIGELLSSADYYHLSSTVFNQIVFLRSLRRSDESFNKTINYFYISK